MSANCITGLRASTVKEENKLFHPFYSNM